MTLTATEMQKLSHASQVKKAGGIKKYREEMKRRGILGGMSKKPSNKASKQPVHKPLA
jgi:hypothetical protein